LGFEVWSLGFQESVSIFGFFFCVSVLGFLDWGLVRAWSMRFQVSGFGFRASGFGFRVDQIGGEEDEVRRV